MPITVRRGGTDFVVEDTPVSASWHFWGLWVDGNWEKELLGLVDQLLPDGGLLLDVGAWIGPVTLWAARRESVRVIAIEPDPEAYRLLADNVFANGMAGRVDLIEAAASTHNGTIPLWSVLEGWGTSASSMTQKTGQECEVKAIDLAALIELERPNLVKMDIEGGELELFPKVGPTLRQLGIPILLSTHSFTYAPGSDEALQKELALWRRKELKGAGECVLCQPL